MSRKTLHLRLRAAFSIALCLLGWTALLLPASAQGNYEIQVYPYETVEPRHTMVELHSNFTFQGSKSTDDGTLPTNHQLHETIEITHGFNDWFETGFYIFTKRLGGGIEYSAWRGRVTGCARINQNKQQILPAIDLNL